MRKIVIFFLLLVLLAAAGLGVFYLFFDINAYREDMEKKLASSLGFPVQIVGDMGVKKTLTPTIFIPELRVQKPSKQGSVPFMVFKNVDFTFDLPSYLKHIYDVSEIHMKSAQMFFDVNEAAQDGEQAEGLISGTHQRRPSLQQRDVYTLSVHQVKIDSVQLIYQNHINNTSKQLTFSDIAISELKHLSGTIEHNKERFQLKGQFTDLMTTLRTGMNLVLDFRVQAKKSQNDLQILIPNLKTLDLVRMTLRTKGDSFAQAAQMFAEYLPESLVQQLPDRPFKLGVSTDILNQRQMKMVGNVEVPEAFSFQLNPFMWDLQTQSEYSGHVQFQTFGEDVLKGMDMRRLSINTQFAVSQDKIQLDKMSLIVNNSNLDGQVTIMRGELPKVSAKLVSQYFNYKDLDELWKKTDDQPLDWALNKAVLDIALTVQHMDNGGLTTGYPYVNALITSQDKQLTMRILSPSTFAAGQVVGQLQVVQLDNTKQMTLQLLGDRVLLNQIVPFKAHVRGGYINLNVNLKSQGNTWDDIRQNVTGNVAVVMQEGELLSASQTLNRLAATKATASYHVYTHRNIFVKNAIFNLTLKKGIVYLDHNVGIETSNWLDFIIDGSIDLPQRTMELQIYPLRVAKVATVPDPDPSKYISISGPWEKVRVQTRTRQTPLQDGEVFLRQLQKRTQLISIDNYLGRQPQAQTTPVKVEQEKKAPVSVEQQVVTSLSEIVAN